MKNICFIRKILLVLCCLMFYNPKVIEAEQVYFCEKSNELSIINEEIIYLEEVKARFLARALIHEEQAMRWQFDPHLRQEAKRSLQVAEAERRVIQEIQERIDDLCNKRDQILKPS